MKQVKGFTLIEMLVSMTLLTMLLLLTMTAYSFFSERWNGRLGHYNQSLYSTKNLLITSDILQSIISYVVVDDEKKPAYYFEGNINGFVAVSNSSFAKPGIASVIRLQVTQNSDFTFNLSYQEAVMDSLLLVTHNQPLSFEQGQVLFENLTDIRMEYFGWPTRADKFYDETTGTRGQSPKGWFTNYNSIERGLHPEQLKITLTSSEGTQTIHIQLNDARTTLFNNYYGEDA